MVRACLQGSRAFATSPRFAAGFSLQSLTRGTSIAREAYQIPKLFESSRLGAYTHDSGAPIWVAKRTIKLELSLIKTNPSTRKWSFFFPAYFPNTRLEQIHGSPRLHWLILKL